MSMLKAIWYQMSLVLPINVCYMRYIFYRGMQYQMYHDVSVFYIFYILLQTEMHEMQCVPNVTMLHVLHSENLRNVVCYTQKGR